MPTPSTVHWRSAVFFVLAMLTAACNGSGGDATATSPTARLTVHAMVLVPEQEYLLVSEVAMLEVAVYADAGVSKAVTWQSSMPAVATVSGTGWVTAVTPGIAIVTVRSAAVPSVAATMKVEVRAPSPYGQGFGSEQFALIPAGSFQMGSGDGEDTRPVRTVTLSQTFRMQRTEVTIGQWREVMDGAGLQVPSSQTQCGDSCPAEQVSWFDTQQFIIRLNQQDPGKNYRLPTEAEWEYAARAGTSGGGYPGHGALNDIAWSGDNSSNRTRPVAWKLANAFGLYDMLGNVWEWVNDWYSDTYYSTAPNVDPPGPAEGSQRVLRGGSAYMYPEYVETAFRGLATPSDRQLGHGFRLVRDP